MKYSQLPNNVKHECNTYAMNNMLPLGKDSTVEYFLNYKKR